MSEEQDPPIGYASPPKHTQFKKGVPQPGRTRKAQSPVDIVSIISEPWTISEGRGAKKVHPFELSLRQICNKAIKGDMRAARAAVIVLHKYGVITPRPAEVLRGIPYIPYDHDHDDWMRKYKLHGEPPWEYEHDGMSRLEELRDAHR